MTPPRRTIGHDVACVSCGQNLRGLAPDGRCPECAYPVTYTLRGGELHHRDPDWLRHVRLACSVLAWLLPVAWIPLAWPLVTGGLWAASRPSPAERAPVTGWLWPAALALLGTVPLLAAALLPPAQRWPLLLGVFSILQVALARTIEHYAHAAGDRGLRRVARATLVAATAATGIAGLIAADQAGALGAQLGPGLILLAIPPLLLSSLTGWYGLLRTIHLLDTAEIRSRSLRSGRIYWLTDPARAAAPAAE